MRGRMCGAKVDGFSSRVKTGSCLGGGYPGGYSQIPFWTLKRVSLPGRVPGRSPMSDFFRTMTRKGPKSAILDSFGQFWRTFRMSDQIQSGKWHWF